MFQFLQDLYSGKLHREFHYGKDEEKQDSSSDSTPDKIEVFIIQPILTPYNIQKQFGQISKTPKIQFTFSRFTFTIYIHFHDLRFQIDRETGERLPSRDINATPPPSQFANLGPSRNRYTLLHDEF